MLAAVAQKPCQERVANAFREEAQPNRNPQSHKVKMHGSNEIMRLA
jgi:hypothetical protein